MEWVIVCNPSLYNVEGAFNKYRQINWKQSINAEINDIIYIYVGRPVGAINYKCLVTRIDLEEVVIDDSDFVLDGSNYENHGRYMELKKLDTLSGTKYDLGSLKENGLKTVQGPSRVSEELSKYLNNEDDTSDYEENFQMLNDNRDGFIERAMIKFQEDLPAILKKDERLEKMRTNFVSDFNFNNLMTLTKEEYVVGAGSRKSFCYRIETELEELGDIHGSTAAKFGLYYGKSGNDDERRYRIVSKFGETPDEALENIKKHIVNLLLDGRDKNLVSIRESKLSPMFRGKILSIYYPNDYLCIFSANHLDYFISKLSIFVTDKDDILSKQLKLIDWKRNRGEFDGLSNQVFMRFLYTSFGRPFEKKNSQAFIQKERDENYPKDFVLELKISKNHWVDLLKNPEVFRTENINFMKRVYQADNHAVTLYDLGIKDGVSSSTFIPPIVHLAKRVSNALQLEPIFRKDGRQIWWGIPFWGREREDDKFEWKLRPELAKALETIFPELVESIDREIEQSEDDGLVDDLKLANVEIETTFEYSQTPKEKSDSIFTMGHKTYRRDRRTAINALIKSNYSCEIDGTHQTFIRKNSDRNYTEPHHLVPMAFSDDFEISLDVEENIVSLCSNCHNHIHYGNGADELLDKLYKEREQLLKSVGINISPEKLLECYRY